MAFLAVAAGVLAVPGSVAEAAFSVHDPDAGIVDPVAGLPVLDRNCQADQLDINTASESQLRDVLGVSRPVAGRIIDARPFLRPVDSISVPGVGPSERRLLETEVCAEPVELPEPTPLACETNTEAVDLQSASADAIAAKTGLGLPTAERLVAARPLPQDLQQVTAPRVPGLSGPVAARLVEQGRVCVTPAPFTFSGKGWRWASEAGGAVVSAPEDDRYQLFVPPWVTAGPTGAWATVLPLPERDPGRPRADFHIYGDWHGTVGVRMPDARLVASDAALLVHERADGAETFTWGDTVAVGDGTVTAAFDTLSESESSSLACGFASTAPGALFYCGDAPADEPLASIGIRRIYQTEVLIAPTFTQGPCNDTARIHSEGELPLGLECTNTGEGPPTATWSLTNTTGAAKLMGLWEPTGAIFTVTSISQTGYTLRVSSASSSLEKTFAEDLANRHGLVLSDTTVSITKARGSGKSSFDVGGTGPVEAGSVWAAANIASLLNEAADLAGVPASAARETVECLADLGASGGSPTQILGCLEGIGGVGLLARLEDKYEQLDGRTTRAIRLMDKIRLIRFVAGRVTLLGNAVASAIEQVSTWTRGGGTVRFWYDLPPIPPGPGAGSGGTNSSGAFDGKIINDTSEGRPVMVKLQSRPEQGWVVLGDYLAQEIADVRSYTCFAHRMPLRDQLPSDKLFDYWTAESTDEVFCDSSTTDQFYLTGNETNVILRQYATGGGVAPAWFVDSQSRLRPIRDGGVYRCLAQTFYVLDGRFDHEMDRYAGKEAAPANCP